MTATDAQKQIIEQQKQIIQAQASTADASLQTMSVTLDGNLSPDEEELLAAYLVDVEGLTTKILDWVDSVLKRIG